MAIDPGTAMQGLAAWKTAVDTVKTTIDLFRQIPIGGASKEQKQVIEKALTTASSNTAIAEAQLAQAFGYELCRCQFPPTPMLLVGHHWSNNGPGRNTGESVIRSGRWTGQSA